jgi:hypothetical protein
MLIIFMLLVQVESESDVLELFYILDSLKWIKQSFFQSTWLVKVNLIERCVKFYEFGSITDWVC